ncbi:ABC transporter permease [Ideonella sp. B508-1]|uniref:ABC transporter permease n=1 Tax=Ideonella sp. B508-1 TaxID=137716 RepID=UPI0003497330|nr:ABC transporter permease [Ideonella sp. B508-1]
MRPEASDAPRRPLMWVVRGAIPRKLYWLLALVGLVGPLLAWWFAASAGGDSVFLPTPAKVWGRVATWWTEDDLLGDVGISIFRVVAGFLLSAVIALPLGLLIGSFRAVQGLLEPLTEFIRYMPAVAFIPLVMLWVGIDESSKVAIIFIGVFFQMVLLVADDVRRVPLAQIEAAQTMGATRQELVEKVILPSAKPALLDTLRVCMGSALDLPGGGRAGGGNSGRATPS